MVIHIKKRRQGVPSLDGSPALDTYQERNKAEMKRLAKMFMATCIAALALAAVASGASATTTFTASETGEVTSFSTGVQTFTVGGANVVKCQKAHGTGTITGVATTEQEMTVNYSECSATFFGFPVGGVDISAATYNFKVSGEVEVLSPITIKATSLGCETIVGKQILKSVSYANSSPIKTITTTANVTGIVSTSPNGCPTGTSGTYTGVNDSERVGGGTVSVD
jgi:hypothetical protein